MCLALMVDPQGDAEMLAAQKAIRAKLEDWIPKILAAQEPDGYLQTHFTLANNPRHWNPASRGDHEGYTAGYFIEAAIAHYLMTGKTDARHVPGRQEAGRLLVRRTSARRRRNRGTTATRRWSRPWSAWAASSTRRKGPARAASTSTWPSSCWTAAATAASTTRATCRSSGSTRPSGHAVRAVYCYSGMADVAMETGDVDYQSAVQSLWSNIVNKKYYVTGGVGSGETSEGLRQELFAAATTPTANRVPNCGELFFQHKLNLAYHDAHYADLYEETLYNAILGDVDLEAKNFTYTNALDSGGSPLPMARLPLLRRQHPADPAHAAHLDVCHERATACT